MVFAGMLPWTFFSTGLSDASNSLINNANLISKVYFPRLIVPTATVVVAFVDFLISFCILIALMVWYQFPAGLADAAVAGFRAACVSGQLGAGAVDHRAQCQVSGFSLRHPVYRAVWPLCLAGRVQLERRAREWRLLYSLNPMVGVIDGFRWCILGGQSQLYLPGLGAEPCASPVFLWLGIRQFRKMERSFADLI